MARLYPGDRFSRGCASAQYVSKRFARAMPSTEAWAHRVQPNVWRAKDLQAMRAAIKPKCNVQPRRRNGLTRRTHNILSICHAFGGSPPKPQIWKEAPSGMIGEVPMSGMIFHAKNTFGNSVITEKKNICCQAAFLAYVINMHS